ncbi:MAG: signal peptidase I [Nodosilinea sp.]
MDPKPPLPSPELTPDVPETSPGVINDGPSDSRWKKLWAGQVGNLKVLGIALVIALGVRLWIAEPRFIPSNSMDPTLYIGDRLIVDKVSYRWQAPHRGDIVVFAPPPLLAELGYGAGQAFIKRVIGEPGQTLAVSDGQVIVDGSPLQETYILERPQYEMPPVAVPPGYVFVMGDNRNDSNDSHVWGPLPQNNIIGRARWRFWPLNRLGSVS